MFVVIWLNLNRNCRRVEHFLTASSNTFVLTSKSRFTNANFWTSCYPCSTDFSRTLESQSSNESRSDAINSGVVYRKKELLFTQWMLAPMLISARIINAPIQRVRKLPNRGILKRDAIKILFYVFLAFLKMKFFMRECRSAWIWNGFSFKLLPWYLCEFFIFGCYLINNNPWFFGNKHFVA